MGVLLVVVLAGIAIGVGAYHAGETHGLEQAGRAVEVVRVYRPGGFFPFGLILFPLFFFGIIALLRAASWHRRWDGSRTGSSGHEHWGRSGPWGERGPARFEEWHRRQHEGPPDQGGGGGQPATA
jgi:hypothetical protein